MNDLLPKGPSEVQTIGERPVSFYLPPGVWIEHALTRVPPSCEGSHDPELRHTWSEPDGVRLRICRRCRLLLGIEEAQLEGSPEFVLTFVSRNDG